MKPLQSQNFRFDFFNAARSFDRGNSLRKTRWRT